MEPRIYAFDDRNITLCSDIENNLAFVDIEGGHPANARPSTALELLTLLGRENIEQLRALVACPLEAAKLDLALLWASKEPAMTESAEGDE